MKKLILTFISIFFITSLLSVNKVEAELLRNDYNLYDFTCELYEVDYINDDGTFEKVECYSDYNSAYNKMIENNDYVVRNINSLSPSKIVAMNSGLVYSYPGRSNSETMTIYQNYNETISSYYKTTYLANHYEMTYLGSSKVNDNGTGYVHVVMNGFDGYADLENVDLVPSKFIDNSIGIYLGGNDQTENEQPFYVIPIQNYYICVTNGNYNELVFHYHRCYSASKGTAHEYTIVLGPAPEFMETGKKYYSNDNINYYSDTKLKDLAGTYYPYYSYLPLRSTTSISGETLDSYISAKFNGSVMAGHGEEFINLQNIYGVNALGLYSLACLESAGGTSYLAINKNNLYGWGAIDSDPINGASYFESIYSSIEQMMGHNLTSYMNTNNPLFFGTYFGSKGSGFNVKYASDPYWGLKIGEYMYSIDKYANNYNGKLTEYNKDTRGVITTFKACFYSEPSTSSKKYYTSEYGSNYQLNNIVTVIGEEGNFYKVQLSNPVDENGNVVTSVNGLVEYNFDRSVAYILKSDVSLLNNFKIVAGWNRIYSNWYYYNADLTPYTGWLKENGKTYYLKDNGSVTKGIKEINGKYYYFNSDGAMETGLKSYDNKTYYFNEDGTMAIGWKKLNNNWYYFNSDGTMATGLIEINSKKYYLNSDGTMATGFKQVGADTYYFNSNGAMVTGWLEYEDNWYYLKDDGTLAKGLIEVKDKTYYMNEDGSMAVGFKQIDGDTYYFSSNGSMITGWLKVDNTWYYLNEDGKMATGLIEVNDKSYYMNEDGSMATGWLKLDDIWYYFNSSGSMKTGWLKLGNTWYYLNEDGKMATGLIEVNDKSYYMNEGGSMRVGWKQIDDIWYYFNASGDMAKNKWVKSGSYWYYMLEDGSMAKDTYIGSYYINSDGIWVK